MFVQLREHCFETLGGDAAIESIVDLISFPLICDVIWFDLVGVDYSGHLFVPAYGFHSTF